VGCSVYHVSGHTTKIEGLKRFVVCSLLTALVSLLYYQIQGEKRKIL
jgi:hypothetical protein